VWFETFWRDVRFGTRTLRKAHAFSAFAIAVLALGIGASTAIFSVADVVLIRPLPYRDPSRLVMVWEDASFVGFHTTRRHPEISRTGERKTQLRRRRGDS